MITVAEYKALSTQFNQQAAFVADLNAASGILAKVKARYGETYPAEIDTLIEAFTAKVAEIDTVDLVIPEPVVEPEAEPEPELPGEPE